MEVRMRSSFAVRKQRSSFGWRALACAAMLATAAGCEGVSPDADVSVVRSAVTSGAAKINCGTTTAVSPFIADTDFSGGGTITRNNTIDLSAVYNPAPAAVYQSQRYGNFTYTVPGFGAGSWNQVRLHFADTHWTAPGARVFNVTINGVTVLKNFDIIKLVGAGNKALVEQFTMPANSSGQYVIAFSTVTDAATVSGIEVGPVTWSGTPTKNANSAYAKQCQQQLVPLPPSFGGSSSGTQCSTCFQGTGNCTGCKAGSWTYSGQISTQETIQSFNGSEPVDMFYWESTDASAPGLCMLAPRKGGDAFLDFAGVICQSALTGAVCYWDLGDYKKILWDGQVGGPHENGHVIVPSTAVVITSPTTSTTTWVGGADLTVDKSPHRYQNECSDCHSGRNAFNNHPNTATDLPGRGLISASSGWFPAAWPSPIVPDWDPGSSPLGKPWPLNPGPQPATGFSPTTCFNCHKEGGTGGLFPAVSQATPRYCATMLNEATGRPNRACSASDINCPTGAMPFSLSATAPSSGDEFSKGMLRHHYGQCVTEFRTTFAKPPLASGSAPTLLNAPQTLGLWYYDTQNLRPASTFAINSAGKIVSYDSYKRTWSTSTQSASMISMGADRSLWMIKKSGSTSYICAANADLCTGATCTWKCDTAGYNGYAGIFAGNGKVIWALDNSRLNLWGYLSTGSGQYTGDAFNAMGEWDPSDPIRTIAVGGDGDMWVLTQQGHIQHQVNDGLNAEWQTWPTPPGGTTLSIAVANGSDVWTGSSTGLYHWDWQAAAWQKHCPTTACTTSFTALAAGGQEQVPVGTVYDPNSPYQPFDRVADIFAIDTAGNVYRVDQTKGLTVNSLIKVGGPALTQIAVGGQGDVVGMDSAGTVYTFQ
jgi:hypothetical protein